MKMITQKRFAGPSILRFAFLSILLLFLSLSLTACRPQEVSQPDGGQEQVDQSDQTSEQPTGNGNQDKIAGAKRYLQDLGLNPLRSLTQSPEGDKRTITWRELSYNQEADLLNFFLDGFIQTQSAQNDHEPVDLSFVSFELAGERVADVYFYEDEIIGGVTYPQQDVGQIIKDYRSLKGETLDQIRNIDFPVWQVGQSMPQTPSFFYLEPKQAKQDGFEHVIRAFSLGQGQLLLLFERDSEVRAYVYDLKTGRDFYTGISSNAGYLHLRVKPLANNQVAVMLQDKLLIVERNDFKVVKEFAYPHEIYIDDIDISPDGKTIVTAGSGGLTVYDGEFKNGKILVPAKVGSDPHGLDSEMPRYPVLSPDSSRILYRVVGYEWLVGTGTIALDGSDHRYFAADEKGTTYIKWIDDTHIYGVGSHETQENHVIRNIITGEERTLVKNELLGKNINYFQFKDNHMFTLEMIYDEDYNFVTGKLGYFDLEKQTNSVLLENRALSNLNWYEPVYDEQYNVFVLAIANHPLPSRPAILAGLP